MVSLIFALQVLIDLSAVAMFGLMAVASVTSILANLDNQTATLEMPYWLFMGPMTVGMTLITLESAIDLVRTLRRGRAGAKHTSLA